MIPISNEEMEIVQSIIKKYSNGCKVLLFGSRLKGDNELFSDLDLAFICKEGLEPETKIDLQMAFEESNLPYRVDVVDYGSASKEFQKIISKNNKKIFG
ncbi:MAG: nucleotidyltransferase domain-containing protein [Methanobrevibacter sp.]|jgi:type I restriction enzyme S subunit|nr:nucleotidyltransferase domain-containing protein [Candidatus Methanovirga aequatorialis]